MQVSPRRVATARITSAPAGFATTFRNENDPLGAFVTRVSRATRVPSRVSTTVQGTPFRFWSTSTSTSIRLFSLLSFSFAALLAVHVPRTSTSPSFASAGDPIASSASTPGQRERESYLRLRHDLLPSTVDVGSIAGAEPSAGKAMVRVCTSFARHVQPRTLAPVRDRRQAVEIVFDHATKRYPGRATPAVDDLSMTIPEGEICCLVGPSGGGKTTAMKLVNRLVELTSGDVRVDGTSVNALDETTLRRGIGYVIQQVGLFPHMTVAENVATVPKLLGWSKREIAQRTDELLDLVDLPARDYRSRYASQLSGGERQRVGLARALAADPPVMLMDEPFGALDPITRTRLQNELLRIQDEVRKTIIFVTHDIDEAILVGDRIAILREGGVLAQYDTPEELLAHPADDFVARFVGADRGLKRLSLTRLDELELSRRTAPSGPLLDGQTTLRDALSTMLNEGTEPSWSRPATGRSGC